MKTLKTFGDVACIALACIAVIIICFFVYYLIFNEDITTGVNYIDDQLAVDVKKADELTESERDEYEERYFMTANYYANEKSNGHGYITNMQMLKTFSVTVRVYAGNVNGTTYYLSQNNFSVYRVACASFSELLASGTLFYSISLSANGYAQMQLTFEGASLVSSGIFSGSLEIVGMSFTLVDF